MLEQNGLAATAGPHDSSDFAGCEIQVYPFEYLLTAKTLMHIHNPYHFVTRTNFFSSLITA